MFLIYMPFYRLRGGSQDRGGPTRCRDPFLYSRVPGILNLLRYHTTQKISPRTMLDRESLIKHKNAIKSHGQQSWDILSRNRLSSPWPWLPTCRVHASPIIIARCRPKPLILRSIAMLQSVIPYNYPIHCFQDLGPQ